MVREFGKNDRMFYRRNRHKGVTLIGEQNTGLKCEVVVEHA